MNFDKTRRLLRAIEDLNNNENYYKDFVFESDGSRAYSSTTDAINDLLEEIYSELNEIEKDQNNYYEIYQLKKDLPNRRDLSFISYDELLSAGERVDRNNYDLIYTGDYNGESLDEIYQIFNIHHPDDFKGHSLSVSDIVVIHDLGESEAYYVDSAGFKNVPEFFKNHGKTIFDGLVLDHYLRKTLAEKNREKLIDVYKRTTDKTPAETIQTLIEEMGADRAIQAVAEAINATSDDGRLSHEVIEWAKGIDCTSKEDLEEYGLYSVVSWIHPAHLNQIGQEMMKKEKEMNRNMKVEKTLSEYFGDYIDKDAWDTEVDMCVGFVADFRDSDNMDFNDKFLSYLADNIIVTEDGTDSMVCDFSGFFEKHQDELKELYSKAGWNLEDEFDEDEIHYDFVSSVLPNMISGNTNNSTYKLFLETFDSDSKQRNLYDETLNTKNEDVLKVLGEVFSEYSKHFDPMKSKDDEQKLLSADKAFNYIYQLLHNAEVNQGYTIINTLKSNGDFSYVIGYDKDAPNPYVVWTSFTDKYNNKHYSSGTYVNSLYEATKIQAEKANSVKFKNDLFDMVNMAMCIDKHFDHNISNKIFDTGDVSDTVKYYVEKWRNWDKTLDDDIRDFNTIDSMMEFIDDNDYNIGNDLDDLKINKEKGHELQ